MPDLAAVFVSLVSESAASRAVKYSHLLDLSLSLTQSAEDSRQSWWDPAS